MGRLQRSNGSDEKDKINDKTEENMVMKQEAETTPAP